MWKMGDRIAGAELSVNLHIAIYIMIQWVAKGTSMSAGIQSLHRQAQAQNVDCWRKRLLLGVCKRFTFRRRGRVLRRLGCLEWA